MAEYPDIDVTKIDFPSDGLTIKAIRHRWPLSIDTREDDPYSLGIPKPFGPPTGELIHNMLVMERDFAKATFGLEFGRSPQIIYADNDLKTLTDDLGKAYIEFGLASGPHHAEQLVRSIESQAIAQARQHTGPRP